MIVVCEPSKWSARARQSHASCERTKLILRPNWLESCWFGFETKALKTEKWQFSRKFQRGRKPFFWENGTFQSIVWYPTGEVAKSVQDCPAWLTCRTGQSCLVWARARVDNNKGLPLLLSWFWTETGISFCVSFWFPKGWGVKWKHTCDLRVVTCFRLCVALRLFYCFAMGARLGESLDSLVETQQTSSFRTVSALIYHCCRSS